MFFCTKIINNIQSS